MVFKQATKRKPDSQWDMNISANRRTRSPSRSADISPPRKIDSCTNSSASTDSEVDGKNPGLGKLVYKGKKGKLDLKWDTSREKHSDVSPSGKTAQLPGRGRHISPKKRKRSRSWSRDRNEDN